MKYCPKCEETKDLSEFYKNKAKRLWGVTDYCKICWDKHVGARRKVQGSTAYKTQTRLNREWKHKNADKVLAAVRKWEQKNPDKHSAHVAVRGALKYGKLVRKPCEVCGKERTDAHHDDYSKKLEVRWLCRYHHKQVKH